MKKIILLLLLTLNYSLIFSQHPDLQQGKWFVQSLTIDGTTTNIPNEPLHFPYAYINFTSLSSGFIYSSNAFIDTFDNDFQCEMGFTGHIQYDASDIFTFQDFSIVNNDAGCNTSIQTFMNLYISYFNTYNTEQFNYTITTNADSSKTLTIINNNEDVAVFVNAVFTPPPSELTNTWFLNDLIINGNHNSAPNNSEISTIILDFAHIPETPELFATLMCAYIDAYQDFNISSNQFYLYSLSLGLIDCGLTENTTYQNLYFSFFIENQPGAFNYALTNNNETLTITAPNGDQAIYSNTALAIKDNLYDSINIYPNPTNNYIYIKTSKNLKKIIITDVQGRKVLDKLIKNNYIIDITKIEKSIYFLNLYDDNNLLVKKEKIIKK